MRDTVELIVKALVDNIDAVDVREIDRNGATLIEIRVAPEDMGKVIGKQGRTVRALRSLAHAVGCNRGSSRENERSEGGDCRRPFDRFSGPLCKCIPVDCGSP
jgi:predicted RNA-binding protein YlqC (UPF0109 family)